MRERRRVPYLDVNIRPIVDQQLKTQSTVCGGGSEVQRGEATVVGLVHVSTVVRQLVDYGVLPVVAGQVERRVPIDVDFIDLQMSAGQGGQNPCSQFTPFPQKA